MFQWVHASHGASAVSYAYSTWLFLRLLGVVYAMAFLALGTQIKGLVGSRGILPAADYLRARVSLGRKRFWRFPTVFWWNDSDAALSAACVIGAALSLLLVAGVAPVPVLVALWVLHLSLFTVCRLFLSYQWDILLLEAGVLAIFVAPLEFFSTWPPTSDAPAMTRWLLYWLLFRLMLSSGLVKLLSGDRTWRNLTALCFHYQTQPLPNRPAWYVHQFPRWFHTISALVIFAIEIGAPVLIFAPRPLGFAGAAAIATLMVLIFATGNYSFFNLLTIALCVLLVDDAAIAGGMRWLSPGWDRIAATPDGSVWPVWILSPVAAVIALLSLAVVQRQLGWPRRLPGIVTKLETWLGPYALVNSYGLFGVMTTRRNEIVIEGSSDGQHWLPYEFKWKPGDERRAPRQAAPHHPRLDWQMWFAARRSAARNPWMTALLDRLLTGSPDVLGLLGTNPFPGAPPKYVRARLFDYAFTTRAERRQTGRWWRRTLIGTYSRAVSRPQ